MIVLDTQVIIWDALKPEKLSQKAKVAINSSNNNDGIIFCEISLWEIAMLIAKKRIYLDTSYQEFIKLLLASNKYFFAVSLLKLLNYLQRYLPKLLQILLIELYVPPLSLQIQS